MISMVIPHNKLDANSGAAALQQPDAIWETYCKLRAQEHELSVDAAPAGNFVGTLSGLGILLKSAFLCNQPVLFSDHAILHGLRQRLVAMRMRWDRLANNPRKQDLLSQLRR